MLILGIETSCDETAAAVVENGRRILSNVVVSQIDIFAEYGGVIPEVAARNHLEVIMPVIDKALKDANKSWDDIDAIAVTHTPGLLGSLLIGTLTARTLAILHKKPLYAVHHLKSHIYANWLTEDDSNSETKLFNSRKTDENSQGSDQKTSEKLLTFGQSTNETELNRALQDKADSTSAKSTDAKTFSKTSSSLPEFPLLALVVSGGHTQILYMSAHNHFEIIGTTRDDAVGECFDKVAKILGLPYPGGPAITSAANGHIKKENGEIAEVKPGDRNKYKFPHPNVSGLDFSFSGLKTAVLRTVQKELGLPINHPSYDLKNHLTNTQIADFAASFEKTAVDILLEKLEKAYNEHPEVKSFVIAGGVSANSQLRSEAEKRFQNVFFPKPKYSGDNGAMVAAAAFYEIESGVKPTDPYSLDIAPRSPIH